MKNKLLMLIMVLGFTKYIESRFIVEKLNKENIELIKEKNGDNPYTLDHELNYVLNLALDNKDICPLVCFTKQSKKVCGFLEARFSDGDVYVDNVWVFDKALEKEIKIALINALENKCRQFKKKKIVISYTSDDTLSQNLYDQLGYKKLPAIKRTATWLVQSVFGLFMLDDAQKGTFVDTVALYKKL